MSGGGIESIAWALHVPGLTTLQRMVLVGVCNHDGDGGAWPSIRTLAGYACCTPRSVSRTLAQLEKKRLITRVVNGGGMRDMPDDRRPNLYVIHRPGRGDTGVIPGVTGVSSELPTNYPLTSNATRSTGRVRCRHFWKSAETGECPTCG